MPFKSLILVKIFGITELTARDGHLGLIRQELTAAITELLSSTGFDSTDCEVVVYFPEDYLVYPRPVLVEVIAPDFPGDTSALFDLIGKLVGQHFAQTNRRVFLQSANSPTPILRQY